jgi:hypothetical protein
MSQLPGGKAEPPDKHNEHAVELTISKHTKGSKTSTEAQVPRFDSTRPIDWLAITLGQHTPRRAALNAIRTLALTRASSHLPPFSSSKPVVDAAL